MTARSAPLKSDGRTRFSYDAMGALLVTLSALWDALSVGSAYAFAYQWRALAPNNLMAVDLYWGLAQFSGLTLLVVFAALGLYRAPGYQSRFNEVVRVVFGVTLAFTLVLAGAFFFRGASFSRLVVLYAWGFTGVAVVAGRLMVQELNRTLRERGIGLRQVLIVGTGPEALTLRDLLIDHPEWGLRFTGYVAEADSGAGLAVVTRTDDLAAYLRTNPVAEVWFALSAEAPRRRLLELVQVAAVGGAEVRLVPDVLEFVTARMSVEVLGGTALLALRRTPLRLWYNRFAKRTFDIVLAGGGLVVALPLLALIALAVKATSPGPILYSQERIGRDGQVFRIYKFRTMRVDAERSGPGWTVKDDPRRTPLGAFLRRTSLDELPQLWNVLVGEMSLVGPRPERPVYVERFSQDIPKYLDRHLVKTGITGWAQIHGLRGDTSIAERVRYDLYYIENWSLLLDVRIVLFTLWQVLFHPVEAY